MQVATTRQANGENFGGYSFSNFCSWLVNIYISATTDRHTVAPTLCWWAPSLPRLATPWHACRLGSAEGRTALLQIACYSNIPDNIEESISGMDKFDSAWNAAPTSFPTVRGLLSRMFAPTVTSKTQHSLPCPARFGMLVYSLPFAQTASLDLTSVGRTSMIATGACKMLQKKSKGLRYMNLHKKNRKFPKYHIFRLLLKTKIILKKKKLWKLFANMPRLASVCPRWNCMCWSSMLALH